VRFLGFTNQSQLPSVYAAADVFVLPSEYDPCPVVVCEAMLCGCPAIISDEIPGRLDIVRHGETGFVYPCGDVDALSKILGDVLTNPRRLQRIREAARARMETWSPRETVQATLIAVENAVRQE